MIFNVVFKYSFSSPIVAIYAIYKTILIYHVKWMILKYIKLNKSE